MKVYVIRKKCAYDYEGWPDIVDVYANKDEAEVVAYKLDKDSSEIYFFEVEEWEVK